MNTREREAECRYEIVSGPNKDRLFDACKYAYKRSAKVTVEFGVVQYPTESPVDVCNIVISGLMHEDGSGESFCINGYCKSFLDRQTGASDYRFEAFYNTKTRKGWITFSWSFTAQAFAWAVFMV